MDQLCSVLASRYPLVLRNIPLYSKKKCRVAEIDVLAVKGKYCDVYEVKCSYRLSKARKQLSNLTSPFEHSPLYFQAQTSFAI
ncbi:MAG: hypothetical protein Q8R53_02500 [Nanoarchaeota archaeon]|nr:hypothetical protein [Nanoarchaeota archaeon]